MSEVSSDTNDRARLQRLAELLAEISRGNLSSDAPHAGIGPLGGLERNVALILNGFRGIVTQGRAASEDIITTSTELANSTDQISSSVQQVSTTVQQIAKGSQLQAEEIDQINKLTEDLEIDMKKLASKMMRVSDMSGSAGKTAYKGSRSAGEAEQRIAQIINVSHDSADNIKGLAERCDKISSVLDVIRKIAGKTNLLALNAAIEAARAGEAGRGFAVVADEVKDLAEGSARSSEEIEIIISQIQQDARQTVHAIESGMKEIIEGKIVINKALQALDDIAKKVHAVDDTIKEVSDLLHNQVRLVEQISKRAGDIASVAEENAGATEESAAATEQVAASMQETTNAIHDLKNLGTSLQDLLSKFAISKGSAGEHRSPPIQTGSEREANANYHAAATASDSESNSIAGESNTNQPKGELGHDK